MGRYVGVTFSNYSFGYYSIKIDLVTSGSSLTYCTYCKCCYFLGYGSTLIKDSTFMRDYTFNSLTFSLRVGDGYYSINFTFFLSLSEFLEDVLL